MSKFNRNKQSRLRSGLIPRSEAEAARLPEQVADYISLADTRFDEVAHLYLDGLTINDLQFMQPEDLINVVPPVNHKHKLLMSILVRRYLFRDNDEDGILDAVQRPGDIVASENDSESVHSHLSSHHGCHRRRSDGRSDGRSDRRSDHRSDYCSRSDYCKCSDCTSSRSSHY